MIYQYDGDYKLSIEEMNKANALRALVNEYFSPTVDSEMFLFNKFELRSAGPTFTVISLDDNELVIMNGPAITSINNFKVDMKLTKTMA